MDTSRLWRVIRGRWWIVAVFAAIGALAAYVGVNARNNAITPVLQAEAPVTIFPNQTEIVDPSGQILDSVLQQLDNAHSLALGSNATFLELHPDASVRSDANLGRLTFVVRAETDGAAQALASQMRANYLQEKPFNRQQQVAEQIDEVTSRMADVRVKLEELDVPSEAQIKADSERSRLTSLVSSLKSRQTSLEQELLFAPLTTLPPDTEPFRTEEDIQTELDAVREYISTYESQIAALPSADDQFSVKETFRRALQREFRELEISYQDLFIEQNQATGPGVAEVIEVFDQTPASAPVGAASGIGLIIGTVFGILGLGLSDRVKRPFWTPTDAKPLKVLAEIPPRRQRTAELWYELQDGSPIRKRALQGLRASVEARIGALGVAIGIAGVGTDPVAVHEFAGDLAASLAAAGHSVLLLDADFEAQDTTAEFGEGGNSLARLMENSTDDETELRTALESLPSVLEGVRSARSGTQPADPTDMVAGSRFRALLNACREVAEVTVFALPNVKSPLTTTALDRLDYAILAVTQGVSPTADLQQVADEVDAASTSILGVVTLGARAWIRDWFQSARSTETALDRADRLERSSSAEEPEPRASAVQQLKERAEANAAGQSRDPNQLGEEAELEHPDDIDKPAPDGTESMSSMDRRWRALGKVSTVSQSLPDIGSIDFEAGHATPSSVAADDEEETSGTAEPPEVADEGRDVEARGVPDEAIEKVLKLLRDRIERILTGSINDDALRADILPILEHQGFIPIVRVRKQKTLGDLVRTSLRHELEPLKQRVLEQSLRDVLKRQLDVDQSNLVDLINEWTATNFFADEISRRETPSLWHLTSSRGAFQALIYSQLCNRQRLEVLVKDLTRVRIDMLVRRARRARNVGDLEKAARLEAETEDVRNFRATLQDLLEGTSPEARLYYPERDGHEEVEGWDPDFSQDLMQTLAPIERLGLLPIEVLGAEGLARLSFPLSE